LRHGDLSRHACTSLRRCRRASGVIARCRLIFARLLEV
jgi:hypothetical protein